MLSKDDNNNPSVTKYQTSIELVLDSIMKNVVSTSLFVTSMAIAAIEHIITTRSGVKDSGFIKGGVMIATDAPLAYIVVKQKVIGVNNTSTREIAVIANVGFKYRDDDPKVGILYDKTRGVIIPDGKLPCGLSYKSAIVINMLIYCVVASRSPRLRKTANTIQVQNAAHSMTKKHLESMSGTFPNIGSNNLNNLVSDIISKIDAVIYRSDTDDFTTIYNLCNNVAFLCCVKDGVTNFTPDYTDYALFIMPAVENPQGFTPELVSYVDQTEQVYVAHLLGVLAAKRNSGSGKKTIDEKEIAQARAEFIARNLNKNLLQQELVKIKEEITADETTVNEAEAEEQKILDESTALQQAGQEAEKRSRDLADMDVASDNEDTSTIADPTELQATIQAKADRKAARKAEIELRQKTIAELKAKISQLAADYETIKTRRKAANKGQRTKLAKKMAAEELLLGNLGPSS